MRNARTPIQNEHYLRSEHVGDEFKIFVGHCGGAQGAPPAVLYVSEANGLFASAVDIVRLMQLSAHFPPILVVASAIARLNRIPEDGLSG